MNHYYEYKIFEKTHLTESEINKISSTGFKLFKIIFIKTELDRDSDGYSQEYHLYTYIFEKKIE